VLVSVDPERDTPEALARYIAYFGEDNLGLTGELAEIRKLTDALGIFFQKAGGEATAYGVDHSTVVLVIDPRGRLKALFSAPQSVADLVHDLPLIMAGET
jgi:protein SCO1/2